MGLPAVTLPSPQDVIIYLFIAFLTVTIIVLSAVYIAREAVQLWRGVEVARGQTHGPRRRRESSRSVQRRGVSGLYLGNHRRGRKGFDDPPAGSRPNEVLRRRRKRERIHRFDRCRIQLRKTVCEDTFTDGRPRIPPPVP